MNARTRQTAFSATRAPARRKKSLAWPSLGAFLTLFLPGTDAFPASGPSLEAGAGAAGVQIDPQMLPLDGFASVHDPLKVRVVLLDQGSTRVAMAIVDQTSLFAGLIGAIRDEVARDTGTSADHVLVGASHTFSAPHAFPTDHAQPGMTISAGDKARTQAYTAALVAASHDAALAAVKGLRPARVTFGAATSDVNVSRDYPSARGWWLGANEQGYSDKDVGALRIEGLDSSPIAVLANYAVQSSVMDHSASLGDAKQVTADIAGAAMDHVENTLGRGVVSLFLIGAAGDQMPDYTARRYRYRPDGSFDLVDIGARAWPFVELQGERLGQAVVVAATARTASETAPSLRILSGSVDLTGNERPAQLDQIRPSHQYKFTPSGKTSAPYVLLALGDTVIVGVQAELSARTGAEIRARSPFRHTMVVTMMNGAAKYMPDTAAYDRITYEAMNSSYARGSAEAFSAAILKALGALRSGNGGPLTHRRG